MTLLSLLLRINPARNPNPKGGKLGAHRQPKSTALSLSQVRVLYAIVAHTHKWTNRINPSFTLFATIRRLSWVGAHPSLLPRAIAEECWKRNCSSSNNDLPLLLETTPCLADIVDIETKQIRNPSPVAPICDRTHASGQKRIVKSRRWSTRNTAYCMYCAERFHQ
jgi:hypothetical protein